MAADAGELRARATLDNTEFLSALKDMVSGIQTQVQSATEQLTSISKGFDAISQAAAGLAELEGIKHFITEATDAAVAIGKLEASFKTFTGTAEEAEQVLEQLHDLSLHSTFSLEDVLGPDAQQMLKLGVSATDTATAMQALADAAAAMKAGPGFINEVSATLANMSTHIVATTRDMKALGQEGVDAWVALAQHIGTDVPTAMELVNKKMISSQEVIQAVSEFLEQQYGGAAARATGSWIGALAQLKQPIADLKAAIGESINATLQDLAPIITAVSNAVEALANWIKNLSPQWKEFIGDAALAITTMVAVAGALTAIGAAMALLDFNPITLAVGAAVAALALIGKWVYDEWPAIKAVFLVLWDDIKAEWEGIWNDIKTIWDFWVGVFDSGKGKIQAVVDYLKPVWQPLIEAWTWQWNTLKGVIQDNFGWIEGIVKRFIDSQVAMWTAVKNMFATSPIANEINKVSAAWQQGQQAIAAHNKELADQKQKQDDVAKAAAATKQKLDAQATADKLAAEQAKERSAAAKKASEDAKKAAEEEKKYNDDLLKTYNALYAIAPDVAQQFSDMYGGISTSATEAQKVMGKVWDDADPATRKMVEDTLALGDAYKTLGTTGIPALEGALTKAVDAFDLLQTSGTTSNGELTKAFDAVVSKAQAIVTLMSTDVKDAYDNGLITQQQYYDAVVANAQKELDAKVAAYDGSLQKSTEIAAAEVALEKAKQDEAKATQQAYTDALQAIGEKTTEQLDAAISKWTNFTETIQNKLGGDSKQAIEASINLTQALIDKAKALGDGVSLANLQSQLSALQTKLENLKTPAEQFADDMKKLGVNTTADAVTGIDNMAKALADARTKSDGSLQSTADLAAGTKKLTDEVQKYEDELNGPWKQALQNGDITITQYLTHAKDNALLVEQQFSSIGTHTPQDIEKVNAATRILDSTTKQLQTQTLADTQKAFQDLGVNSQKAMDDMARQAAIDFGKVASSANENGTTYMNAWINAHKKIYDAMLAEGTSLSSAQKEDMAKMEAKRDEFLEQQKSAWGTAYHTIKDDVGGVFDDLTKQIVTGDFSFGKLVTKLWTDIADAALNAFINPLKTAITNFIAHELADLLGDKGLGGILSGLTGIGKLASSVFSGGASAAAGALPGGESLARAAAGAGGEAASAGGGAASAVGSAVSSVTGIVGAVGGVVGAVAGIVGDIQNVHMANVMGQVEHNTRYAQLYLGGQADGGILAKVTMIDEKLAYGPPIAALMQIVEATENSRDIFIGWSGPMIDATHSIERLIQGDITPYLPDIKSVLEDIRDLDTSILNTLTGGFQGLQVTINAGNLTTADAARQLGNQIAANLSSQMVAIKG